MTSSDLFHLEMPNKNVASPQTEEATGQTALPLSRIKKIIQLDKDIAQCSHNATFLIAMATELFIQYLAEQGNNVAKSERKPRKTMQYKDLATAVSRIENLEFLADVIPKTTTYKQYKEKRAKEAARHGVMEKGQRKLNGGTSANGTHRTSGSQSVLQLSNRSHPSAGTQPTVVPNSPGSHSTVIVPRRADTSGHRRQVNEDVEMTG